jgi:chemotaxis protein methyltransferase CheR
MTDDECVALLQWALPRLGLRWGGFRRVRRQVCRRVSRRLEELGLADAAAYRRHLAAHPDEWRVLDGLCRVTISRFWRDRRVFESLRDEVLPGLASPVRAWSAGCAGGEEPYSLVLAAAEAGTEIEVLASDTDPVQLERATRARYPASSLRELPPQLRDWAFAGPELREAFRRRVTFLLHDVRDEPPNGPYDLVLCRNLVFTYFADDVQRKTTRRLTGALRPGGLLVVGAHERPPADELEPVPGLRCAWRATRS